MIASSRLDVEKELTLRKESRECTLDELLQCYYRVLVEGIEGNLIYYDGHHPHLAYVMRINTEPEYDPELSKW